MDLDRLPLWESYSPQAEEVARDKTERPPLTGKDRFVPEGLYEQPWSSVNDAYGKATLTPYYIEALTSDDANDVRFGTYGLYSATTHQGSVYKASGMAIPFLVALLARGGDTAEWACHFLARIALGEHHFISAPSSFGGTRYYRSVGKYRGELLAYYHRTGAEEAMRLLCFIPGALPDRLDFSRETALEAAGGDSARAFARQASTLLAQGFLAAKRNFSGKGYPQSACDIAPAGMQVTGHVAETRALMQRSPSLLVRGCAAICLAYTGVVDGEILELLGHLGEQELRGVPWVWEDDFSRIARKAWMYSADLETLIDSDRFLTLDYTSYTKEGVATPHYSPSERLATVAARLFPERYTKSGQNPPLLPGTLTEPQKRCIRRIVQAAPNLLGSYQVSFTSLPLNRHSAGRLLGESGELLCTDTAAGPLWYVLERAVLENTPEAAVAALAGLDAPALLCEIYRTYNENHLEERCTLDLAHAYDDRKTAAREEVLESILATALAPAAESMKPFLDEWLEKAVDLVEYDWKYKVPGQRIGIALLATARAGRWEPRYEPLARPYHPVARFSNFPVPLLIELLEYTSPQHRESMRKQFHIKN